MRRLKSHVVTVRFDTPSHERLQKEADDEGVSVSELIRNKVLISGDDAVLRRIEGKIDKIAKGESRGKD
jgi:Ribbon-helix-helix protein, copG family